ncbi:hypothetical protein [Scytonema sp. NUACC26]|uniref:hypothetical protein n=1 Tax=Scytonema sp. NUACC26 TaxID=3140176 RepID=UPI0034DC38D3
MLQQQGLLKSRWVIERATLPDLVVYSDLSDRPYFQVGWAVPTNIEWWALPTLLVPNPQFSFSSNYIHRRNFLVE